MSHADRIQLKKDGTLRLCVNHRKLNALTKHDSYPILRMDGCIDSFSEAAIFSALDGNSGYRPIEIEEKYPDLTALKSHQGLYRFILITFELWNGCKTF